MRFLAAEKKLNIFFYADSDTGFTSGSWNVTDAPVLHSCSLQYSVLIKAIAGASDVLVDSC